MRSRRSLTRMQGTHATADTFHIVGNRSGDPRAAARCRNRAAAEGSSQDAARKHCSANRPRFQESIYYGCRIYAAVAQSSRDQVRERRLHAVPEGDSNYIPVSIVLPAYAPGSTSHQDTPINYCVERVPDVNAWNQTPYWIFTVPTEIVPDHGTIFTDRFTAFLTAFLPPLQNFSPARPAMPRQRLYTAAPARRR